MALGDVIGQMRQARQHVERARAMISAAMTELRHADALIRHSMQGNPDQGLAALVEQTSRHLTGAGLGTTETTKKIDETLARWSGTGGRGN